MLNNLGPTHLKGNNVNDEIAHVRRLLERSGIKVNDAKVKYNKTAIASDRYINKQKFGSDFTTSFDIDWDITLNNNQAVEFATLAEEIAYFSKRAHEYEQSAIKSQLSLQKLQEKNAKLHNIIDTTPGLKPKWDEFMTFLKLVGFDDTI